MESDFVESKEHVLGRSPFLNAFLDRTSYLTNEAWLGEVNKRYAVIQDEFNNAFGEYFWELGPKSIYLFAESYKVFDSEVTTQERFLWTGWILAMGWELGNPRQTLPVLTDVIERITDFNVFNKEKYIMSGPCHDQICFVWMALNMGSRWKDVSESKTPKPFEEYISKMEIDLD